MRQYDKTKPMTIQEVMQPENEGKWFLGENTDCRAQEALVTNKFLKHDGDKMIILHHDCVTATYYPELAEPKPLSFAEMFRPENVGKRYRMVGGLPLTVRVDQACGGSTKLLEVDNRHGDRAASINSLYIDAQYVEVTE